MKSLLGFWTCWHNGIFNHSLNQASNVTVKLTQGQGQLIPWSDFPPMVNLKAPQKIEIYLYKLN